MPEQPTAEAYKHLQSAYDYFNKTLFDNKLPACLITVQRAAKTLGYFHGNRFRRLKTKRHTDEIAMNPQHFRTRTPTQTYSTLVHEMTHLWQHHNGAPSRTGYHNREWSQKMTEIGLHPTSDGTPTGKPTGQHMTHIIIKNGPFEAACKKWIRNNPTILYSDEYQANPKLPSPKKTKYSCPECELNVWGKPGLSLTCTTCAMELIADA